MHCTKIPAKFEFGGHSPSPGCVTPKMWRFAELRRMTQNVNEAMWADKTSPQMQRAHSIAPACSYDIGKISADCLVHLSIRKN